MIDLALLALLVILAVTILGGVAIMIGLYVEDVIVRPITEDEFSRYLSRPPNSI